jgi:hypothetical protein
VDADPVSALRGVSLFADQDDDALTERSIVKCLCRPGSRSTRLRVKRFTTPTADGVVNMLTKT